MIEITLCSISLLPPLKKCVPNWRKKIPNSILVAFRIRQLLHLKSYPLKCRLKETERLTSSLMPYSISQNILICRFPNYYMCWTCRSLSKFTMKHTYMEFHLLLCELLTSFALSLEYSKMSSLSKKTQIRTWQKIFMKLCCLFSWPDITSDPWGISGCGCQEDVDTWAWAWGRCRRQGRQGFLGPRAIFYLQRKTSLSLGII